MYSEQDSIRSLLQKVKKLADHGFEGERIAAQKKLETLLKKHKLSLEDITDVKTKWYEFCYHKTVERILLCQLYLHYCPSARKHSSYQRSGRSCHFEMSAIEYADMLDAYIHYRSNLAIEVKRLKKKHRAENKLILPSFIHANKLYSQVDCKEAKELSPEILARLVAMIREITPDRWTKPVPQLPKHYEVYQK